MVRLYLFQVPRNKQADNMPECNTHAHVLASIHYVLLNTNVVIGTTLLQ